MWRVSYSRGILDFQILSDDVTEAQQSATGHSISYNQVLWK